MSEQPRTEVVGLLYELSMARASMDVPTQRRCTERLRGVEVRPAERAQADVLATACQEVVEPAWNCQREARSIVLPRLMHAPRGEGTWRYLWASLSDAERARLGEIWEWLAEPLRTWVGRSLGERAPDG